MRLLHIDATATALSRMNTLLQSRVHSIVLWLAYGYLEVGVTASWLSRSRGSGRSCSAVLLKLFMWNN